MRVGQGNRLFALFMAVLALVLAGCASKPAYPPRDSGASGTAEPAQHPGASIAASLVGTPYRYGGSSPRGFDCSGLVYYAYRKAGIRVPRTTSAQLNRARRVALHELQPGDLLFFRLDRSTVSHVGIYTGDGRFVHAPSSGKKVSFAAMNDPYWQRHLVAAGRYH